MFSSVSPFLVYFPAFSRLSRNGTVQSMLASRPGGYNELAIFGVAMQWLHIAGLAQASYRRRQ
jgi:hypothetical protein